MANADRHKGAGCAVLIILTLVFGGFVYCTWNWNLYRTADSWPSTNGEITKSDVFSRKGAQIRKVAYRYEVNGVVHTSTQEVDGNAANANQYPVGSKVVVYYNPDAPEISIVEAGVAGYLFGMGFCVFMAIVAIVMYIKRDVFFRETPGKT